MKVFLSGEGTDDLGDWYRDPQYRSRPPVVGLIEALLRRAAAVEFVVIGARVWKKIRKFRFGRPLEAETHNVLGLMVEADEVGADVLVFVRDRDGDEERAAAIEEGLRLAREGTYSAKVVGGVAVEEIEAWILALLGERRSEHPKDAKRVLRNRHGIADLGGKRAVVEDANLGNFPEDANLDALPDDAVSLRAWLTRVREAFASPI